VTERIRVSLGDRSHDVVVGRGLLAQLDELDVLPAGAERALVVTQEPVARHHLAAVRTALERAGVSVTVAEVPDGEGAKAPEVLTDLWRRGAQVPLRRQDVVVALGGGVVGDLAGLVAATLLRGIAVLQLPTSLLAQVDAAVGGKTAIDLPEGKNLVGAFHQPCAVVADLDALATLDRRHRIEGLGEVLKYGLIRAPEVLALLEAAPEGARDGDPELYAELVRRSVEVKAAVVAADERESGEREHLNLGHTYGHAVETLTGYRVRHGEAVAMGIRVALELGVLLDLHARDLVERTTAAARAVGLPTAAPPLDRAEAWTVMRRDKKARAGVRFVVLEGLASPTVVTPDPAAVDAAIDAATGRDPV
jgi:3-dehydroquinate synthase